MGLMLRTISVHSMGEMLSRIQTYSTVRCDIFLATEGQSISISASALQCTALTGLSLSETYDALMTPPRDDKKLKSWLYPLDTWHIKPCSKRHVLAWEKAIYYSGQPPGPTVHPVPSFPLLLLTEEEKEKKSRRRN